MKDSEIAGLAIELASELSEHLIDGKYQSGMNIIHKHLTEKLKEITDEK
tara:strand:- start:476 stop:622 length:147 start_codon:yes stop_codon:yes gene_type:complete